MSRRHAAVAGAVLSLLALAAPAQAGRENPFCERYEQEFQEAKEAVKAATPPARKAVRKLKGAKRALKNAEGEQAKKKAATKVRKAKKTRRRTKAALDEAKARLSSAERRAESPRCDDSGGGEGPGGGKDRGPKGPR